MDMTRVLPEVEVGAAITEEPWGRVVFVCAQNADTRWPEMNY